MIAVLRVDARFTKRTRSPRRCRWKAWPHSPGPTVGSRTRRELPPLSVSSLHRDNTRPANCWASFFWYILFEV